MSAAMQQECAEAINAALFETGFEVMGNSDNGRIDWWLRRGSERHKVIRVSVERSVLIEYVIVTAEWPAVDGHDVWRGRTDFKIPCDGSQLRDKVIDASTEVVVKILELFRDVLEGKGLADASAARAGAALNDE